MKKTGYVYLLTNKSNKVLYTGVTGDLTKRIFQHRNKMVEGFTKKYNVYKLVYYEKFDDIENAIAREKQIKGWKRSKKDELIKSMNPNWNDLYDEITG